MSMDFRLPNITASTEAGKLQQMQSYMHQLVEQLNWAFNNIDITGGGSNAVPAKTSSATATTQQDDPISNFNSIKGLIIKSADIVNAYYEKIDSLLKLSGYYMAQSDFGTYQEETTNLVSATDKQLRQDLVNKQTIFDENGNIKTELLVNGHIYSGIIEYAKDGEAIVGIEIGQTTTRTDDSGNSAETFTKFARFTADRLSFYDIFGAEVAYISDYKLYITHVEIKGSLQEGGYKDIVDADGSIVTKWVGGANNGV